METAAVYWESQVRIYGFTEKTGLSLFTVVFPAGRLEIWGKTLQTLNEEQAGFDLVSLQRVDAQFMKFCIVFHENEGSLHRRRLEEARKNERDTSFDVDFPVELISFHGPHFQDRYGIADALFVTLARENLTVLAVGCTGTSVQVVVPENEAKTAVRLLAERFVVPQLEGLQRRK